MAVKPLQSVETSLRVLEAVAAEQPVGVSAIARSLGLDKNAVQRSLVTLGAAGWLRRTADETGAWELTGKVVEVARRYAPGLVERARVHLETVRDATGETVLLFGRDGTRIVVLDACDSPHPLRLTVPVGTDVPLRATGAFDAFLPDDERRALPQVPDPPTPAALAATRKAGTYVVDGVYPSAVAVGAPLFDDHGRAVAAVAVVAPRTRFGRPERRRAAELVRDAAARISRS